MSWRATAYVAELTDGLTPAEKLVLMCLANRHHQDTGKCNPSIPRLAEESLTSERNLYRLLSSLKDKGFVTFEGTRGRGRTNEYEIVGVPGKPDNMSPFTAPAKPTRKHQKPDTTVNKNLTENLTKTALKGDTAMSPEQGTDQQSATFVDAGERDATIVADKYVGTAPSNLSASSSQPSENFSLVADFDLPAFGEEDDQDSAHLRLLKSKICDACGDAFLADGAEVICGDCMAAFIETQRKKRGSA